MPSLWPQAGLLGPIKSLPLIFAAEALMVKYAPGVPFQAKFNPVESEYREFDTPRTIKWYICDGLDILLHEIGHHVCRHTFTEASWRQEITEEVEAWLWAEKTSKAEGLPFNYAVAEKWFATYFSYAKRRQSVNINWRWKIAASNGSMNNGDSPNR